MVYGDIAFFVIGLIHQICTTTLIWFNVSVISTQILQNSSNKFKTTHGYFRTGLNVSVTSTWIMQNWFNQLLVTSSLVDHPLISVPKEFFRRELQSSELQVKTQHKHNTQYSEQRAAGHQTQHNHNTQYSEQRAAGQNTTQTQHSVLRAESCRSKHNTLYSEQRAAGHQKQHKHNTQYSEQRAAGRQGKGTLFTQHFSTRGRLKVHHIQSTHL